MILRRTLVAMLCVLVCVVEGATEADKLAVPTGGVLTSDELDQVVVGMVVEIVYGKGSREEAELATVRGFIGAVDWERRLVVARADDTMETIAMDRIQTMMVIDVPKSLTVEERPHTFYIENRGLRIARKVVAGSLSCVAFTGMTMGTLNTIVEPATDYEANDLRGIAFFLTGVMIGSTVGFSVGVTAVDPYDSEIKTLLTGSIPGVVGLSMLLKGSNRAGEAALSIPYFAPILSLIVSEQSRRPPQASQDSRVSFGVAPILNGGLSAAATLRF